MNDFRTTLLVTIFRTPAPHDWNGWCIIWWRISRKHKNVWRHFWLTLTMKNVFGLCKQVIDSFESLQILVRNYKRSFPFHPTLNDLSILTPLNRLQSENLHFILKLKFFEFGFLNFFMNNHFRFLKESLIVKFKGGGVGMTNTRRYWGIFLREFHWDTNYTLREVQFLSFELAFLTEMWPSRHS